MIFQISKFTIIIIPCPLPSQAKVHRALLLSVLTDARHVFTILRNFYVTFLHVSFWLLVPNQGGLRGARGRETQAFFMFKNLHSESYFWQKKDTRREADV